MTEPRRKLLFFIWALEVGGAERLLAKLVQRMPRERFDMKIVCLARRGAWAAEVEAHGIPVHCLDKRTGLDPTILFRLLALLRREKPDLVNTHLWTADVWARLAAILMRVPVIVTEQNVDVWKKWYHRLIDRLLFRRTDAVICVSGKVAEFYRARGVPKDKLHVIPNAVDLSMFDADRRPGSPPEQMVEPGVFSFICAARLHPQKAHGVLLRAVRLLMSAGSRPFMVLLAGEGPLRPDLERQVAAEGLSGHVHFLGLRQDLPSLLQQCDAFVLPSLYEGLPLAILEAMAAGLPIVATDVGGNADLVEHGRNGFLVPPNDPQALARAMAALIDDGGLARAMGAEGRQRVARDYSIDVIAERTARLFEERLAERRSRPEP